MGDNRHEKLLIKNYLSKIHSKYHQHKNRINEIAKDNEKKTLKRFNSISTSLFLS